MVSLRVTPLTVYSLCIIHQCSCARAELHEEGQLAGGEMVRLLEGDTGLIETKWCINKFFPFLVIDPHRMSAPPSLRVCIRSSLPAFYYAGVLPVA